ncbi:MAG: glycoside hydrolase family 16 protein, partial [Chitinivibrionales bacterium]|nr:glycoside hydrolase family 16 protein [Chitinivibrionales bacterium]
MGSQINSYNGMAWGSSGWAGMKFTPSSNLPISQLGRYNIAGSTGTYDIRIFDAGTGADVAKAMVNLNGQPTGWVYAAIIGGNVTLQGGHAYYLMTNTLGWNGNYVVDYWYDCNTTVTATAGITVNEAEWGVWSSGSLFSIDPSKNGFQLQYGYWEARVKMPASGNGQWASFCTYTTNANATGCSEESDIFEEYGFAYDNNNPQCFGMRNHNWGNCGTEGGVDAWPIVSTPWDNWHIYGYLVTPTKCYYYIDGQEAGSYATPTDYVNGPSYMSLENNIGGWWPVSGVVANSHMDVDWVRVWAPNPNGTPPPVPGLVSPGNGATNVAINPTLNWNASSGATSYSLQVSTN